MATKYNTVIQDYLLDTLVRSIYQSICQCKSAFSISVIDLRYDWGQKTLKHITMDADAETHSLAMNVRQQESNIYQLL